MKKLFPRLNRRALILMILDIIVICGATLFCAMFSPYNVKFPLTDAIVTAAILAVFMVAMARVLKTYSEIWRYAGPKQFTNLISVYMGAALLSAIVCGIFQVGLTTAAILFSSFIAAFVSIYARMLWILVFHRQYVAEKKVGEESNPAIIIGAGSAAVSLARELLHNNKFDYEIKGFVDDDPLKIGMEIEGANVLGKIEDLPRIIKENGVRDLVLAIPSLERERKRQIIDLCTDLNCRVRVMPEIVLSIVESEDYLTKSLRSVSTEDLLGRDSVMFEQKEELKNFIGGKSVLVTGGAGSIGSELCRQIAQVEPGELVIFDVDENNAYMLYNQILKMTENKIPVTVEIGSMNDDNRVRNVFEMHKPSIVFHAAAHKHVPLMEHCPYEAVRNNILGTYNIMRAANEYGAEKMVMISTDKAVNPTSIMGATKRYCEDMIRAYARREDVKTQYVAVRFGNVLGSAGSVVPIFKEQIAKGGPVTITDKRITRYFMTIPEAVGLVLRSGAMAEGSETYILDMGEPVHILDLAENLIKLSGFEPYTEIDIVETGLRAGEKLYEELLVGGDDHVATKNSKIFVERNSTETEWSEIEEQLRRFKEAISTVDNELAVSLIKEFVPDYAATVAAKEAGQLAEGSDLAPETIK